MHLSIQEKERRARQRSAALSERDAARYIGMSESWLRHGRLYQADTVPPHLRLGRSVRYLVSTLDTFLAERENGGGRGA
jgi:predicted DNA-binding transcriptional regulator AlpA